MSRAWTGAGKSINPSDVTAKKVLFPFALVVLALGCRSSSSSSLAVASTGPTFVTEEAPVPLPAHLIPLPLVRQATDFSCGNVAALSILRYYEPDPYARTPESALYAPMSTTPEAGTEPGPIADYLSKQPVLAAHVEDSTDRKQVEVTDLERAVDRGEPTIVALQAWQAVSTYAQMKDWRTDWDDGHYAVVVGYDESRLFFMDPSTSGHYAYIPVEQFAARWHDTIGTAHVQHIAIFVHATGAPAASPGSPLPADAAATIMN
jgi:predicted double-glycine peptidase